METEQERPYHIQAIYDLQADYSTAHFRFAIGECRKVVAQLIADDHSSDQQIARVNILRYLDLQLSRATAWAEGEADLLAIVLRSEIELRGWAEFVSESELVKQIGHAVYEDALRCAPFHGQHQAVSP